VTDRGIITARVTAGLTLTRSAGGDGPTWPRGCRMDSEPFGGRAIGTGIGRAGILAPGHREDLLLMPLQVVQLAPTGEVVDPDVFPAATRAPVFARVEHRASDVGPGTCADAEKLAVIGPLR
jgi:hypothetical protein